MSRPGSRAVIVRAGVLVLLLLAGAVAAVVIGVPDAATLRARVGSAGPAAPVVFVLAYAVATLMPLPKNVLTGVAGLLFGIVPATLLVLVAAVLGAVAAFGLGRALGREGVERFTGARVARVDASIARRGVLSVIGVRLVPVIPFTAVNYAAGLTAVRFGDYLVGTAVGIIPGTVAYVILGAYSGSLLSWPFLLAAGVLLLLSVVGVTAARRSRRRSAAEEDAD